MRLTQRPSASAADVPSLELVMRRLLSGTFARLLVLSLAIGLALTATFFVISANAAARSAEKKAAVSTKKSAAKLKRNPVPDAPYHALRGGMDSRMAGGDDGDAGGPAPTAAVLRHPIENHSPREHRLRKARTWNGDLRTLPSTPQPFREKPEFEGPTPAPIALTDAAPAAPQDFTPQEPAGTTDGTTLVTGGPKAPTTGFPNGATSFDGMNLAAFGNGFPPDTVGDVGPHHYIQAINTHIAIYDKATGSRINDFSFNTFMSQGHFGNHCDTDNFGDPVVLYDSFEDRWILTDFAFALNGSNPALPYQQCFAVSKTGDPVSGGWNFYSITITDLFGDYPKFGVWPDGIYMGANMFNNGVYSNARVYAFNKAQLYSGSPVVQVVSFDAPSGEFTVLPANARLQTGTPSPGSPNPFAVVWQFLNEVSIYKFHVDWNAISTSTFAGPFMSQTPTWWSQYSSTCVTGGVSSVPSPANRLDSLYPRLMMQNQYTNINGVESVWASHTVGAGNPTSNVCSTQAAVRYYQVKLTGGNVESTATQSFTYSPETTQFRFMPSVGLDHSGDLAIGYSTSNATTNPAIKYSGRLANDPLNSITQGEQLMIQGGGSQNNNCGGASCIRWGDYAAMALDPDGCTFWFTTEYYVTNGNDYHTRIGPFSFQGCSAIGTGTLQGHVTASGGGALAGVTVALGTRTTQTDSSGFYSFSGLPAGTYPTLGATLAGYGTASVSSVAITDGGTTTQDFALAAAAPAACITDTTQSDFLAGVPANTDLTTSPGDVQLSKATGINQQNTNVTTSGFGFNNTAWAGQTFTPSASGKLTRVDLDLFCASCTGTTPNLTVSIRATAGTPPVPTGADLPGINGPAASIATITGFNSGAGGYFTADFSANPIQVTAGTRYAVIVRAVAAPSAGTYAYVVSSANPYASGQRVTSANSGGTWVADVTSGGRDLGFKVFIDSGFAASGTFASSTKDANPAPGAVPTWGAISWTTTTPAGTNVKFQAGASNSPVGPFTFVGPDGTAATFFSSGSSLSQFNGFRYLQYKATLSTTDSTKTPQINDVTICFTDNQSATSLTVAPATGTFGGTVDLSATLTSSGSPLLGKTISFQLNGTSVGSSVTDATGTATLSGVSLSGIGGGTYPTGVAASFGGDAGYSPSTASAALTVNRADQTVTFGALADRTYGDADFALSATASSGLDVSFSATGNCTVSGSTVHISGAGSCSISASQPGDANYNSASATQSFNIAKAALSVSADNATRVYGQANPGFTGSLLGVVNGDNITVSYTTGAVAGSNIGSYDIVPVLNDPDARLNNYNVTVHNGTLTITPAALSVTAADATRSYGTPNPAFTGSVLGVVNSDNITATYGTIATANSPVGTYAIIPTLVDPGNRLGNYSVTVKNGTLTITTATVVVTANNASKLLNAPNPAFSAGFSGFLVGDSLASLQGTLSCVSTATQNSPVGTYPITCSGLSSPNYVVQYVAGTLSVNYATGGACLGDAGHSILPPVSPAGSSVFKGGSTVPAKFRVCDANGVSQGTPGVVSSFRLVGVGTGTLNSTDAAVASTTPDATFRWDPTAQQWIFNMETKALAAGSTYAFRIGLNDGSSITFQFGLR